KGLAAEREQNDSLGMAMDILSISDYYIKNERYEQAVAYLDQLKEINEKRNDRFGIAITNEFYGHSYLSQGKLDQADHYYQKALNIYDKINNLLKSAEVLNSLGGIQMQMENP